MAESGDAEAGRSGETPVRAEVQTPARAEATALLHLRALVARTAPRPGAAAVRLPPERDLAAAIGVSRPTLRRALQRLEDEDLIWRHVGRGTFVGPRADPLAIPVPPAVLGADPAAVMAARLALEPALAAAAAAAAPDAAALAELRELAGAGRGAPSWRAYELADTGFHLAVARLSGNPLLGLLAETLHLVRRAATWNRGRGTAPAPSAGHHSFAEHEAIAAAIAAADPAAAAAAMRAHLERVAEGFSAEG